MQERLEWMLDAIYKNVPEQQGKDIVGPSDNVGADILKLSVGEAIGLKLDYYVQINLAGFTQLVNALGGITVNINYPDWDTSAPFGGYKQSGNGREYADWGIMEFIETKGIVGYGTP